MTIKRKDFQKAAALIHEFQLKLSEETECAELRDALNLALLHMQRYYRLLRSRLNSQEKSNGHILTTSLRGLSPMTPFKDAPDKFQWKWINLENPRLTSTLSADVQRDLVLPSLLEAAKIGDNNRIFQVLDSDEESVHQVDGLGRSALMYGVHCGHLDAVQLLLEHGINMDMQAHDGSTAVHLACHEGNHEALQIMIEYNADLTIQDVQGRAPIHWACANKETDCLKLLLEQGVNPEVRDREGLTPSMWACRTDHIDHFSLLTQAYHLPDEEDYERDNSGKTWMHWAIRRTEPLECLKTLLTAETANLQDDENKTVIHTAAEQGSLPATKVILEISGEAPLEHRDGENRTPLIIATIGGHGELVNFLLSEGADLASVDNNGATAWDYARGRQLHYCMLILASYIRQRAKQDGESVTSFELMNVNDMLHTVNPTDNLPMGQLQINGADSDDAYLSSMPVTPPHPPQMPPTTPRSARQSRPRTPGSMRGQQTPRDEPATPRAPTTPRAPSTPRTPSTPRSSYALKRSPMQIDDQDDNASEQLESASSGGKRKKSDRGLQERMLSVMSIESADFRADSVQDGLQQSQGNQGNHTIQDEGDEIAEEDLEHESVSISEMDVSDLELSGDEDKGAGRSHAPATGPQPPANPHPRYQWKPYKPTAPTTHANHAHYAQSRKSASPSPHPPKISSPPRSLSPPEPELEELSNQGDEEEEDDGPGTADLSPRDMLSSPRAGGLRPLQGGARALPPAHLSPLDGPPPSPARRKKKKKKKDKPTNLYEAAAQQALAAPVMPPNRAGPLTPTQTPTPMPRPRERSPSPQRRPGSGTTSQLLPLPGPGREQRPTSPNQRDRSPSPNRPFGAGPDPLLSPRADQRASLPKPRDRSPSPQRRQGGGSSQLLTLPGGGGDQRPSSHNARTGRPVSPSRLQPDQDNSFNQDANSSSKTALRSLSPSGRTTTLPQAQPRPKFGAPRPLENDRGGQGDRGAMRPSPAPRVAPQRSGRYPLQNGPSSGKGFRQQAKKTTGALSLPPSGANSKVRDSHPPSSSRQRKPPSTSVPPINPKLTNGRRPPSY